MKGFAPSGFGTAPVMLDRVMPALRVAFLLVTGASLLYFAVFSFRWPMMVNAPVMHYVNFLMSRGLKPYREITDMNMPGAYLLERTGMLIFGSGDLGWRLYDYFLSALTIGCMALIAKPYDWLAGVCAGGLFALRHGSEGAWFSGEREQEMMVLLVAACTLLFLAVRRRQPMFAAGFGLLAGLAASIKPTLIPFGVLCLPMLYAALKRREMAPRAYLLWSFGGLLVPALWTMLFLAHFQAFHAFLFVLHAVTPVYAVLNNATWGFLIRYVMPDEWMPLVPLAVVAFLLRRQWTWEIGVLAWAALCGLLSYLAQHKGFWYQRYTFVAFWILLVSLQLFVRSRDTRRDTGLRLVACVALLYLTVRVVPHYVRALWTLPTQSALTTTMESDLASMGGDRLQGEVQCFDITFGCLNTLYHLHLLENTGFTGDLLLFPLKPNKATDYYRDTFWRLEATHPAQVLVITNQEFGAPNTYLRLERWPEFQRYLNQNYRMVVSRSFPYEDKYVGQPPASPQTAPGYRLYVRRDAGQGRDGSTL